MSESKVPYVTEDDVLDDIRNVMSVYMPAPAAKKKGQFTVYDFAEARKVCRARAQSIIAGAIVEGHIVEVGWLPSISGTGGGRRKLYEFTPDGLSHVRQLMESQNER